ncbi:MAG: glycosyltransferase [Candidatus Krumholzibacteria bacterium]|nr:glycosyltransferase [Candidatus Krumholzibacteria bacterium]
MKLAVVIINYNSSADLDKCLDSLVACAPAVEHSIVVVDNASVDEGLDEVHRKHPDCLWIFNKENVGYARGCNRGMAQVDADYYLILNPDIVVQPGALDRLLEFADAHPRAGVVGPQLLNTDGSIQNSCRRFYTLKTLLLRRTILGKIFSDSRTVHLHLMDDFDHRASRPVDWILGGCMLARRSAMERVGPMDERFFLYFEDVDWCFRMWQAGFEVQYTPDARFMHHHRRDSAQGKFSKSFWLHLGSLISFYEKWGMFVWLMKKWRDPLLVFLLWALDMAGLTAAFGIAYGLRGAMGGLFDEPLYPVSEYIPLLMFSWLLATLTFLLTGRYRPGRHRAARSLTEHLQQIGVVAVLLLASTYLGHLEVISRAVLLMFIPLLAVVTAAGGEVFRRILRRLEKGNLSLERTLLSGDPGRIRAWLASAGDPADQGVDVAGYVADDAGGSGLPPLGGGDIPWLGSTAEMLEVVKRYRISQVVFWDRPASGDATWITLASLRRLRVRLRWQVEDVWLLAAGARAEVFGGALSAVKGSGGGTALRVFGSRLLSLCAGLILGLTGLLPWIWFRLVLAPSGRGSFIKIRISDLWGHQPRLTLAVSATGRVLALPWQWALAGVLLKGGIALFGPRPLTDGRVDAPRDPDSVLAFWRGEPRAPGLTGRWSLTDPGRNWASFTAQLRQLWNDPGGFGTLGAGDDTAGMTSDGAAGPAGSRGEVS